MVITGVIRLVVTAIFLFFCGFSGACREPVPPVVPAVDESDYTVYYVDSGPLGDDSNDGLSENTPLKTLAKVSELPKRPKMKVLFKSGSVFSGHLILADLEGTPEKPFIVDKYGDGLRPLIDGDGSPSAVEIRDGNIRFRNIGITNKTGARGIYVTPVVSGAMKNIAIAGCRVEEVNWNGSDEILGVNPSQLDVQAICPDNRYAYSHGGIILEANTPPAIGPSWFEHIFITDNEVFKVARTGVWVNSQWAKRPGISWGHNDYIDDDNGWYPARNVVVQKNDISYTGGDGAVLIATRNSFLDGNKAFHANYLGRTGYYNVALWPHSSIDFVMQYNEVAYTHLENGGGDGEGLDVDIGNINCLVQFNYVHHNDGGGILICNNKTVLNGNEQIGDHRGTVIRNNLFYDNGKTGDHPAFCTINSKVGKTDLYNNTVIVTDRRPDVNFVLSADWAEIGKSSDVTFRNNIFMATAAVSANFDIDQILNCRFENNLVFQLGEDLPEGTFHTFDPKISWPVSFNGYENGLKFVPEAMDVYKKGIVFDGMSDRDMAGNATGDSRYLGALGDAHP